MKLKAVAAQNCISCELVGCGEYGVMKRTS